MSKMTFCTFDGLFTLKVEDGEEVTPNSASEEVIFLGGVRTPFGGPKRVPKPPFWGYRPLYISITKWRKVVKMTFWHFDGLLTLEVGDHHPVTLKCGPPPGNDENDIFDPLRVPRRVKRKTAKRTHPTDVGFRHLQVCRNSVRSGILDSTDNLF